MCRWDWRGWKGAGTFFSSGKIGQRTQGVGQKTWTKGGTCLCCINQLPALFFPHTFSRLES